MAGRKPKYPEISFKDQLRIRLQLSQAAPERYYWSPDKFLPEVLGLEIYEHFTLDFVRSLAVSWLHLHAREAYRQQSTDPAHFCLSRRPDLPVWQPGQPIVNTWCLQGGHKLGKSYCVAGILEWIVLVAPRLEGSVYANKISQANQTTWRYVRQILQKAKQPLAVESISKGLVGGRTMPGLRVGNRTVQTQALESTEAIQGGHEQIMVHIVEEAEGVDNEEAFNGIRTMVDGSIGLWILCANPHTTSSPFARLDGPTVKRFSWSCLDHPNVRLNKMVIPGAVSREWIEGKLYGRNAWVTQVDRHDPARHTFEIPWIPGKIFAKLPPWFWRVEGVTPPIGVTSAPVNPGVYKAACSRLASSSVHTARIGVDVGRGGDEGAIGLYHRHALSIWQELQTSEPDDYVTALRELLAELYEQGCRQVEIRVDQGGGYGDHLLTEAQKLSIRHEFVDGYEVIPFNSNGKPNDSAAAADAITEAYLALGVLLEGCALLSHSIELEEDLTARRCDWIVKRVELPGRRESEPLDVPELEEKKRFRARFGRSPNRGDALAICASPARKEGWG